MMLAVVAVTVLTGTLVWALIGSDPDQLSGSLRPEVSERADLLADPLVAAVELGTGMLFAGASVKFTLLGCDEDDRFLCWLGTGCTLAAVASLDYALFPSLSTSWLHTGDVFLAATFAAWAVGAAEEISSYWAEMARLARVEERRRIARDLHDGLAQELAFLVTHSKAPPPRRERPDWLPQLRAAAEARPRRVARAITALGTDPSLPLDADLGRTAHDIAARSGARVMIDVNDRVVLDPGQQEALVRIVREAVTNATNHGRATMIAIDVVGADPGLEVPGHGQRGRLRSGRGRLPFRQVRSGQHARPRPQDWEEPSPSSPLRATAPRSRLHGRDRTGAGGDRR